MYSKNNWVDFVLNLPIDKSEVEKNNGNITAGIVVLGDIIHKSVPNGLEKYSNEKSFIPLGITKYKWQFTSQ